MATYDLTKTIPAAEDLLADDILNCTYTGSEISVELPAGRFKIEAYGAAGATNTRNTKYTGGEGGYSYGTLSIDTKTVLYLNAGGTGGSGGSSTSTKNAEGYNGGGYSYYYAGSGGGATHVATTSGLLASLENSKDSIIIVAGGGGGSAAYSTSSSTSSNYVGYGGKGGGESGQNGSYGTSYTNTRYAGQGGTQSAGGAAGTSTSRQGSAGSFGQGGNGGTAGRNYYGEGGGGGGYYGGGGASGNEGGGGGGSGYLSSQLTDSATSQGGNSSNGYITITVLEIYPITHIITFYDGTTVLGKVETGGEETITLPTAPTREGYKFVGYFLGDGSTQITETTYETTKLTTDISCYTKYRKYNVNFYVDDVLTTTLSTTGKETVTFPNDPIKEGYTFTNWYLADGTTIFNLDYLAGAYLTEDLDVYAGFIQKYTVKFVCDDVTYKEVLSSGYESITIPETVPTKDGYTFQGWYLTSSYVTAYTEDYFLNRQIKKSTTIYGYLKEDVTEEPENPSNVNFFVNDELYYTFSTKGKEVIAMPSEPSIKGYRFKGWFADKSYASPVTENYLLNRWIAADISIYAKMEEIQKYSVIYLLNGKAYYTYKSAGQETFKQPSDPKLTNYEFEGWFWNESYTEPYNASKYATTDLTENLNVYGKLKYTKKNNIKFYLKTTDTSTYYTISTTGKEAIIMPSNPTADLGYDFKGWYLDKKLTVPFEPSYYENNNLFKDINVYALFEISTEGPYSLEIAHDGTGETTPTVGTYTVTKGTTTDIIITPTTENFKYLEVNGETVVVDEVSKITPSNACAYFPFNDDSSDILGKATISTSGTPSINTSTLKFGAGSIYFGGSAVLIINLPESFADVFTVECWFNCTKSNASGSYQTLFSTDGTSTYGNIYMHIDDGSYSTYPVCRANAAGATSNTGSYGSTVVTRNSWHHFAYCRNGSLNYYFLDGTLEATVTQSSAQTISKIYIGGLYRNSSTFTSSENYTGYVDDLLISRGCKYTASFTIPTEAYDAKVSHTYLYSIENQSKNTKATAYFGELEDFVITSSAEDGTITPNGETTLKEGTTQLYEFQGNANQSLKALLIDGVAVETIKTGDKTYSDAICLCTFDEEIKDDLGKCTLTTNGSPSISSDQSKFGGKALYLDGSSYVDVTLPSTYADGFTMECWFYTTKANASGVYQTPLAWGQGTANGLTYVHVDDGSYSNYAVCRSNNASSSTPQGGYDDTQVAVTRNVWHHLAVSRTTSACYFFIDGTLRKTVSNTSPVTASKVSIGALVGASVDASSYFTGYIDEVVIYPSNTYSSAFTVPTEAYEMTITNPRYQYTLKNFHSDKNIRAVFSPLLYLKVDDNWKGIAKVYKRISGRWVEQESSELANVFDTDANYAQGTYNPNSEGEA